MLRDGRTKPNLVSFKVFATVEIVVGHKLKKILEVSFIGLEFLPHDDTLMKKIRQSCHNDGIEHINLEKMAVADMKTVEGYAFDESDPCNVFDVVGVLVSTVAHCKCMIDRKMETVNEGTNLI